MSSEPNLRHDTLDRTLAIRGGLVYDGTGAPPMHADLLIHGDRIFSIEPSNQANLTIAVDRVIDATGMWVCPGFIDIHRHLDAKPFTHGWSGDIEIFQGITTSIAGNCGFSLAPVSDTYATLQRSHLSPILGTLPPEELPSDFPAYLDAVQNTSLPLNLGAMLGAGSVRISLKGYDAAPFSEAEMAEAVRIVDAALAAGALGVSVGIMYIPECYGDIDTFARLLAPLRNYPGRPLIAHIRAEGNGLIPAVREILEIAARVGCPLEISHFKACGKDNWRRSINEAIALIDEARANGQDVTCDVYPYLYGSSALTTLVPPAFIGDDLDRALDELATPSGVDRLRAALRSTGDDWENMAVLMGWENVLISSVRDPANSKFVGLTMAEAAHTYGFADGDALMAHLLATDRGETAMLIRSMCQDDVDRIVQLPYASIISDAIYADNGSPHPRMYGAMPKALRDFVLDRQLLTPEALIHKMTEKPARRFGLQDRGVLRPGAYADLIAFDPEQFTDTATVEQPKQLARGLAYSIINGALVIDDGVRTSQRNGALIRA